jgi:dihydropteroate synthase
MPKKSDIFDFGEKTYLMGILNVTPDSFSDGGSFSSIDDAVKKAICMEKDGADFIDVGGESTRPGSQPISEEEEMNRVIPVIEELVKKIKIPISIDTYKSNVAKNAIDIGVIMVNDITALRGDKRLSSVVRDNNVYLCLMHMKGKPRSMQINPFYKDIIKEISDFLKERIEIAISSGIKEDKIIIDPGLGFGKRTGKETEDNCEIINRLDELKKLGYPILVGPSRKSFIGNICGGKFQLPVGERLEGSLAAACISIVNGADIVRVHDVKQTRRCIDLVDRIVR